MMKKLAASIFLVGVLLITGQLDSDQLDSLKKPRDEAVVQPSLDRSGMVLVQTLKFLEEELGPGVLMVYDDTRTKWQIDYIDLYDFDGNLLVVTWLDRFGTCQVMMDRGLLDPDDPTVDGVLVSVAVGTML